MTTPSEENIEGIFEAMRRAGLTAGARVLKAERQELYAAVRAFRDGLGLAACLTTTRHVEGSGCDSCYACLIRKGQI